MITVTRSTSLVLISALLISFSSCVVVKKDNGKHKGWTKNTNNPHHPLTTNPGHTKSKSSEAGKSNGNSNGKGNSKGKGK